MTERETDLQNILGDRYQELADEMPNALSFLQSQELTLHTEVNFDIKSRTLTFIGERSEWGRTGGIARFSRVGVWQDGQVLTQEFNYRDRWNARNDNYGNNFRSAQIETVANDGNSTVVRVSALPFTEGYHPRQIEFRFENSSLAITIPGLSKEEQIKFEEFFRGEIKRIMEMMEKAWEGLPKKTFISSVPTFQPDSPLRDYDHPAVTTQIINPKIGLGAFVTSGQMDHDHDDPQLRYRLYLVKHGEREARSIFEDHAYLHREGDPSIMGLEIDSGKVAFTTRAGRREIDISLGRK